MRGRIRRSLLALAALLTVWAPLAFGHGWTPALDGARASTWPTTALGIVLAAALALGGTLDALRRKTGGCSSTPALPKRPRHASPALAGALLALLVWVLPWLSLHDTHHALERGEPTCQVAQVVHSQGGGILPTAPVLALPRPADRAQVSAPAVLFSLSALPPSARSPPV